MAQTLLEAGQHGLLVADVRIDDAVGVKPRLGDCRCKQILARHAPQHLSTGARHDTGRKQGCCGPIDGTVAAACDLVERTKRETATRQSLVDDFNAKRQVTMLRTTACLDNANPFPDLVEYQGRALLHRIAISLQ